MSIPGLLQVALYVLVIFAITKPLGLHLWRVFSGQRTFLDLLLRPAERFVYRVTGVNPDVEQGWIGYTFALLSFSAAGALVTYAIQRLQSVLPFNPQGLDPDRCRAPGADPRYRASPYVARSCFRLPKCRWLYESHRRLYGATANPRPSATPQ